MQKGKGPYASTYSHPWHRNALSPGNTAQEEGGKVTFKSRSQRGKWKDLSSSRTLCAPFACHSWTKELGGPLPCEMASSQTWKVPTGPMSSSSHACCLQPSPLPGDLSPWNSDCLCRDGWDLIFSENSDWRPSFQSLLDLVFKVSVYIFNLINGQDPVFQVN